MKKRFIFALSAILSVTSLAACGGSSKLPTTEHEKVKFAFNGVEKSLKNAKTAKKAYQLERRNRLNVSSEALDTLAGLLTEADSRGDIIEELEYNQPPIIQFQYLKKVFEKVGNGYEFGTKYYDTMTGDIYVDMETGYEDEEHHDKNKYNYTFTLGIDINIDANDLIKADVSFDINLAKGSESYTTQWYVGIELDYDMNNSSPNYTLAMVTENNELELPYYEHFTYEYDYVEVKDSAIKEWRKFCLSSNQRLVKDSAHTSIDSFTNLDYEVDCFAWYKNNDFRKNNDIKDKKAFANALFNGLGINSTEINAQAFFNKQGQQNSVIKTLYNEFKRILGKDIIYDLVTREEYDEPEPTREATSIRAMNGDLTGNAENYSIPGNLTPLEIFNGFIDGNGEKVVIVLYFADQFGGLMDEITGDVLPSIAFGLQMQGNEATTFVGIDESIYSAYQRLITEAGIAKDNISRELKLLFKSNDTVTGQMPFYFSGDLPTDEVVAAFPKALSDMGVPTYSGDGISFEYNELQNGKKQLIIKNSSYEEGEAYVGILFKNSFNTSSDYGVQDNEQLYVKKTADKTKLYLAFKYSKNEKENFVLTAWTEEITIYDAVNSVSMVGDFNGWDLENGCINFSVSFINYYFVTDITLTMNTKFKFVVNHAWSTRGGYGYSDVQNIDLYGDYLSTDGGKEGNILVVKDCVVAFDANVDGATNEVSFTITNITDAPEGPRKTITKDEWGDIVNSASMVNAKANYTCSMELPGGEVENTFFYIASGDIRISTPASYDPSIIVEQFYDLKETGNPSSTYVHYTYNTPEGKWDTETLNVHYKIFYKDYLGIIFDLTYDELTYDPGSGCYVCASKLSYPYDYSTTAAKYTNISYYFEDGLLTRASFTFNNDQQYIFTFSNYGKTEVNLPA